MKHPLVQKHIDRAEASEAVADKVADVLAAFAGTLRKCPWPEGYLCACNGACQTPECKMLYSAAMVLRHHQGMADADVDSDLGDMLRAIEKFEKTPAKLGILRARLAERKQ